MRLRSCASTPCCLSIGASRERQPISESSARTHEMMHAVAGWKWWTRFMRTAFWSRERARRRGTMSGGQYMSMVGPNESTTVGRWSVRANAGLPFREELLAHEVVEETEIFCLCPRREFWMAWHP